jgi:hypothetical protein
MTILQLFIHGDFIKSNLVYWSVRLMELPGIRQQISAAQLEYANI